MIVTALVMGVASKDGGSMTDAQIMARAAELGMVDGGSRTLLDLGQEDADDNEPGSSQDASGETPAASPTPMDTPEETPTANPMPMVSPTPMNTPEEAPAASPTSTDTPEETPAASPTPTVSPTSTATPDLTQTPVPETSPLAESVEIVVSGGQSSYTVSKTLTDAGLVENALEFDQYLEQHGYSKRISTGTYQIPAGSTWEEIAKIITKSR